MSAVQTPRLRVHVPEGWRLIQVRYHQPAVAALAPDAACFGMLLLLVRADIGDPLAAVRAAAAAWADALAPGDREWAQTWHEYLLAVDADGVMADGVRLVGLPAAQTLELDYDEVLAPAVDAPEISAEAWSDDRLVDVTFDARRWFLTATDEDIRELAACGWGQDFPADRVAQSLAGSHRELAAMFAHIERMNRDRTVMGFECQVDPSSAIAWLRDHRPALAAALDDQSDT